MDNLRALNTHEIRDLHNKLERFGEIPKLPYAFLQNNQGKIYAVNKETATFPLAKLRVNSLGIYFGEIHKGELRLSIEASQIVGKHATRNVVDLDDLHAVQWLQGIDLDVAYDDPGFVLLRHGADILGCGKATGEKVFNYVPKNRRIRTVAGL